MIHDSTLTSARTRAYDPTSSKVVELEDTLAADGEPAQGIPDTGDADRDPRRLGVATQERVRQAVHERVFGAPRDPVRIGRYTVLKRLGQGGMGVVYAAYDTELDRKVALKLLHSGGGESSRGPRLVREAKALAKLSHPSIVAVHEVGEHDGNVFVAMEFVDGDTLRGYVAQRPLEWREIVGLYVQAGRGLAAAHAVGLVHRDFKPDNALVSDGRHGDHASARVRVLDFGLARDLGDREHPRSGPDAGASEQVALTQTGALLGTPAYMAPEQYVGAAVDAHADQFAFCVSLWEALYRERPFDDTSVSSVAQAILSGRRRPPPHDSKVPLALHRVLERGLELRAVDRFSSMVELVDTLDEQVAAGRRGRLGVAIVLAVLALGMGAWVWVGREREHSSRAETLVGEAAVEHARAEQALTALGEREQAVLLAEAKILLDRDPTTAMAKLAQLDPAAPQWGGLARMLAADARDRGVARRVIALPPGREARRWWRADSRWVVTGEVARDGETLLDLDHGTVIPLLGGSRLELGDGSSLVGSLGVLWWLAPGTTRARRLSGDGFYSDQTSFLRASASGRFVVYVGETGDRGLAVVHDLDRGSSRTLRFAPGTEVAALADDGARMVVYEHGELFVHGGARKTVLAEKSVLTSLDVSRDFGTVAWGRPYDRDRDVVVVMDIAGHELKRIRADGLARDDVDLDAKGEQLALRRRGGGLDLFDLLGDRTRHLPTTDEVRGVRFSDDGQWLVVADEDAAIHIWRLADGGVRTIHVGVEIVDFTLDPVADRLLVLGRDQQREYHGVLPALRRPMRSDPAASLAADPSARTIVTIVDQDSGVLRIHRDDAPSVEVYADAAVSTVAVAGDGERIAAAGGQWVAVWRRDGSMVARAKNPDGTMRIQFDGDGRRLAWIGHSGTVVLWQPGDGLPRMFEPTRLGVYTLAFVPGSDRVGAVGWDHLGPLFYMLDPKRGVLGVIPVELGDDVQPRAIAFSSRGAFAFAAVGQGVFVVDARGAPPRRLGGREVAEASLWFSPDGGQLAAVGGRSGATVWDVDSGASYQPALAGVVPRDGFGTIGADGPFTLVADEIVTRAVLGLGGDAAGVRAWVNASTDLRIDSEPITPAEDLPSD
jgi:WD40 repeat protein